jgi:hypothetical protein
MVLFPGFQAEGNYSAQEHQTHRCCHRAHASRSCCSQTLGAQERAGFLHATASKPARFAGGVSNLHSESDQPGNSRASFLDAMLQYAMHLEIRQSKRNPPRHIDTGSRLLLQGRIELID